MDVIPRAVTEGRDAYLSEGQCDPFNLFGPPCIKPIIVAANGRCYTAGLELILASDLCVAAAGTMFGQMEVARGIMPLGGGTFRLPRAIGWHNAMRYILAGETFSVEEAHRWGLVQKVSEPGQLLEDALTLGRRISDNAPLAVAAALKNARIAQRDGDIAAIADIEETGRLIAQSEDAREGMFSLMQRRKAVFRGV
jgi:enoyl-CoA hydratase/carnithine racemase